MTDIEVKDMGYRTCMIITAGNRGGEHDSHRYIPYS